MTEGAITDKKLSRRQFVGAAAGGVAALGAGAILAPNLASVAAATPLAAARAGAVAGLPQAQPASAQPSGVPSSWDYAADVVVIGSGAAGLVAGISAFQGGSSVLVVEVNYDIGGHGICAGGHMDQMGPPDQVYASLTSGNLYQDRALSMTWANSMERLYNWLKTNGVVLSASGTSYVPATTFPTTNQSLYAYYEGVVGNGIDAFECSTESPAGKGATAIYRPLELTARSLGVEFLLNWRMTSIIREQPYAGNVLGITAQATGGRYMPGSTIPLQPYRSQGNISLDVSTANIRANQAVIICDGGHSSNVQRRTEFDFRQTGCYRAAGEPYSYQNGDGEYAARRVGAALWATGNETAENGSAITVPGRIGTEYGYVNTDWHPGSPVFPLVRANGVVISNFADVIEVNMAGARFIDESATGYTWVNAAMNQNAASVAPDWAAGPIWAIFDSAGVTREKWVLGYPYTDPLFCFQANDLPTLAQELNGNVYQVTPMDGATLQATVTRYNNLVAAGKGDTDFGKKAFNQQINTPPYYAAWCAPSIHDCLTGVRMNSNAQVIDLDGNVIPHLYVAGESAGGFSTHGLSKCMCFGLIAGTNAAQEPQLFQ